MAFNVTIETPAQIPGLSQEQTRKALSERANMLAAIFKESPDLKSSEVTSQSFENDGQMATWIKNVNDELTSIGEHMSTFDNANAAKANAERVAEWLDEHPKDAAKFMPGGSQAKMTGRPEGFKTIGQAFTESDVAMEAARQKTQKSFVMEGTDAKAFLERKTDFTTSAGWAPESLRIGRVVLDAQREIEVADAVPVFTTGMAAVVYMEETTFTNNAAERNENAAYAEVALSLTERTSTVRSIGASLPVTDEQIADVQGIRSYLDGRLVFMVRQRLDGQLLTGDGIAPNLEGTNNVTGIQTQALGADNRPDAFHKAITAVKVTGRAQPNVVIMHPNDWQAIRLLQTADGAYIWGSPADAGPMRLWGLPVISTSAQTENTGIVGDYATYSGLFVRQAMEVKTGFVDDDFLDGRVTIRAGIRAALVHFRPAAFATVTGI